MSAATILDLFSSLVSLVYDTFSSLADNELEELAHLTLKFWPKWLGCVESNNRKCEPEFLISVETDNSHPFEIS